MKFTNMMTFIIGPKLVIALRGLWVGKTAKIWLSEYTQFSVYLRNSESLEWVNLKLAGNHVLPLNIILNPSKDSGAQQN
jgi:hypothetical protein